ncbi:MAG: aldose 1-epimerase [Cytophagaceae bacterium]|jgi:aldose 1-epimerase|nr:aldose 1-epimerase [Cytophagaceae bacterium]
MFHIVSEDFQGLEKIKLVNSRSGEYLSVIPAYGGNINELVLSKNNQLHALIEGDLDSEQLAGKHNHAFRGSKLSPFPNRIKDGSYVFDGTRFTLPQNDQIHALHGLLWNIPFTILEKRTTAHDATLILSCHYQKTNAGFPFDYTIVLTYILEASEFSCQTTITNHSLSAMPIGDGWHPYLTTGSAINELKLKLPSVKKIETNDSLIPTGRYIRDTTFELAAPLEDLWLDDCFELDPIQRIVETCLIDERKDLTLVLWQEVNAQGYNFIHVYTPPHRRSIAIEPTSCAPDAFNNKNGLMVLNPQESVDLLFGIRLE